MPITPEFLDAYVVGRQAAADGLGIELTRQFGSTLADNVDQEFGFWGAADYQEYLESGGDLLDEIQELPPAAQFPIAEQETEAFLDDFLPQFGSTQLSIGVVEGCLEACQSALNNGQLVPPDAYAVLYRAVELVDAHHESNPYSERLLQQMRLIVK